MVCTLGGISKLVPMAFGADLLATSSLLSAPLHLVQRACRPKAGMRPSCSAAAGSASPETARERRPRVQMSNSLSKLLAKPLVRWLLMPTSTQAAACSGRG